MGFETFTLNDYEITEDGRIINKKWGNREVKPQPNGKGYLRVHIAGKMYFVHRLVAEKYIPNPDNKPQVNHKDGNKLNNRADNLEWVTNRENRKHAVGMGLHIHGENCPWAKLTQKAVDFIRSDEKHSTKELSEIFGVSQSLIKAIKKRRAWKTVEKIC